MNDKANHAGLHRLSEGRRLVLAALIPLAAFLVQWAFWVEIQPFVWFLFFPAVFFSSWIGGLRGGLLATAISTGLVWYFFIPPQFSISVEHPMTYVSIALFVGMGVLFSVFHGRLRRANLAASAAAVREGEERFRMLFENMNEGVAFCRMIFEEGQPKDFVYLAVNEMFTTLTGLKDVAGKRVTEIIPGFRERDRELLMAYGRVAATGKPEKMERYVESLSMWFTLSVFSPEPEHFVAVFDVINERKRVEATMVASEIRYRRLFESAKDGILILDAETGMVLDVNPYLTELLGYSHEDFLGNAVWDLGFLKDIFANQTHFTVLQQKKYVRYADTPLKTRDGRRIDVEFVSNVYLANQQKVVQCNIRDITERKLVEKALLETEARYQALFERSLDCVFITDFAGHFLDANQASLKMLGYQHEDIVNLTFSSLLTEDQLPLAFQAIEEIRTTGHQKAPTEFRLRTKDGRLVLVETQSSLIYRNGQPYAIQGIARDITLRQRVMDMMQEATQQLLTAQHIARLGSYNWDLSTGIWTSSVVLDELFGISSHHYDKSMAGWLQMVHPEERAEMGRYVSEEILKGHASFDRSYRIVRQSDQQERWVHGLGKLILDEQGQAARLVGTIQDITDEKQAAATLRESQAVYHSLVTQLPVGIFQKDQSGRYVLVNPEFCRTKGMKPEDFIGKTASEVAASQSAQTDSGRQALKYSLAGEGHHEQIMRTGKALETDEEYRLNDGQKRFLHVIKLPVLGADGKVIGTQGVQFDITEVKQAEEALANERVRLRTLVDHLPVAVYLKDTAGRKILSNPADLINFGARSEAEVLGKTDFDLFPLEQAALYYVDDQQVLQIGEPVFDREEKLTKPDGSVIWNLTSKVPLRDAAGRVTGLAGVSLDITTRKRLEEAHERLATAVEQSAESIVITDTQGIVLYANPAFEKTSGYTRAEVLGQNPRILKSGKQNGDFYHRLWSVLERGEIWSGHFTNRRKDGTFFEEEATISPVRDAAGKVVNYVAVKRDVTREVELEAQVRQSQKMEAIGQLAGGVAHDFNNILAVIQLQVGLLKVEQSLTDKQEEYADDIEKAAQRAADLTRQLLLFSRKQAMQMRDQDLNVVVTGIAKMLQRVLGENIQMQLTLASHPLWIHADASMIDQVLMNLAVNARDAMRAGGQLRIETGTVEFDEATAAQTPSARPGAFVCVSVSDTGTGIALEILPRIFEPFFTTKDVGKGTGLGLATVFGIVQQHQGWIIVSSELGQGTTFRVYLPRLQSAANNHNAWSSLASIQRGHETILLVEDDAFVRASTRATLLQMGYRVLEAGTGAEAVEIWNTRRKEVDLLLTDLLMPGGMTGKVLAEQLRQSDPKLKVIYVSGYSADITGHDFRLDEGVNFLSKPFEPRKLAQTIRNYLDKDKV